jgi:hypothetical protein
LTTKETFSIALGVRSAEEQVAARLSQWCVRLDIFKLITPVGCHGQSAMDLWMVLKIDYSSWVPWTKCHGPLDGSQDYIMIIGEFSTSSKDDSAAHILQITKWSSWKSKI